MVYCNAQAGFSEMNTLIGGRPVDQIGGSGASHQVGHSFYQGSARVVHISCNVLRRLALSISLWSDWLIFIDDLCYAVMTAPEPEQR